MPTLNCGRSQASACILGAFIYISGGGNGKIVSFNSIERLNVANYGSTTGVGLWEMIETPDDILSPRIYACFSALNHEELAIFGGQDEDRDFLNDVILFNTRTQTCKKVVEGDDWFCFCTGMNQSVRLEENKIICLALTTNAKINMIGYCKDA
jgi:hypothetical protein